jgi:hypothetical protein
VRWLLPLVLRRIEEGGTQSRDDILVCVPTVLVAGPYRMYFYSHEPNNRPMFTWTAATSR